jgi:CDGSH-type Zn-finger protein
VKKPEIVITKNGPYEIAQDIRLNQAIIATDDRGDSVGWEKGREYAAQEEDYHLCRCGRSANKPYCDGTHKDIHFRGRESADRAPYAENAEMLTGPTLDLMDDSSLCIGARFCDRGDKVWRLVEESAEPEKRRQAIEEACNCPSGRLTAVEKNGKMLEPKLEKEISLIEDPCANSRGPLWIKGGLTVEGAGGEKYETRNRMALCRCGESGNQPYCDGTHYECNHMRGLDK